MAGRLGTGVLAAALAATALATPALARHGRHERVAQDSHCAKPDEATAMQVASVQQELMVAALTCNDVSDFNAFQTAYLKDLRSSDHQLLVMFHRVFGRKGEGDYHAFKTKLANDESMRSIRDNAGFCKEAHDLFQSAEAADRQTLAAFVSAATVHDAAAVDSCEMRTAGGTGAPIPDIVPTPNPLRLAAMEEQSAPANGLGSQASVLSAKPASTAGSGQPLQKSASATPAVNSDAAKLDAAKAGTKPDGKADRKSGWLSGIFH